MEVKLLHLYYDIMNLYGEYGNIKILEKHLLDQGFKVYVDKKTINDDIKFEEYDFIYIGSGTEKNQSVILQDIKENYKNEFTKAIEEGKVILLTGNSYEILGKNIDEIEALGILDFAVERTQNRITADIIASTDVFENKVVGFVNNMSSIKNNEGFLEIEWGIGQSKESKKEGIMYKNLIGTHLIGPLLVRNPEVLEFIIKKIGTQKDSKFEYKQIKYEYEEKAYELVLRELENRK